MESMRIGDLQGVVEAGLCDTATSITVRRPTLSLSRDPEHGGKGGGSIFASMDTEKRRAYPSNLGARTWVLFVKNKRVEGRVKEGTHLPHCVVIRAVGSIVATDNPEDDR